MDLRGSEKACLLPAFSSRRLQEIGFEVALEAEHLPCDCLGWTRVDVNECSRGS